MFCGEIRFIVLLDQRSYYETTCQLLLRRYFSVVNNFRKQCRYILALKLRREQLLSLCLHDSVLSLYVFMVT